MIRPRWLAVLLVIFLLLGAVIWWLFTALVSLLKVLLVPSGPRNQRQELSLSPEHNDRSRQIRSSVNGSHTPDKASMDEAASVRNEQQSVGIPIDVGTMEGLPTLASRLAKGPDMHTNSGESSPSVQQLPSSVSSGLLSPSEINSGHDTTITTPLLPNGRPQPGDIFDDYEPSRLAFTGNGFLITGSQKKKGVRISLDTQGEVSIMRSVVFNKLGLPLEPCTESLVPFRQAADTASIPMIGKVRVDWRFAQDIMTYQTDFYVVENNQFDVLIGLPTIVRYKLLQPRFAIPKVMARDHLERQIMLDMLDS
ncbi:retropepsin-like aspartic protease [Aspergillus niger CBS 101883]|uniref:retropepsin-like aspartic protease n=1 Tax=Aspergillus lacticoffeatus (strain CBS 101883) TaxID=1450533 RepID=UPI000D7F8CAA|nr:uncharacterized protein BO96DRAFT_413163 [Aspergillus niger CBS 101883]PYH55749.1 hypothetical protein BO96DRAFT_413163 [Aspergillus niger CBS 101883]